MFFLVLKVLGAVHGGQKTNHFLILASQAGAHRKVQPTLAVGVGGPLVEPGHSTGLLLQSHLHVKTDPLIKEI